MSEPIKQADKVRIKQLMKTEEWDSVVRFFSYKIDKWREETVAGTNAFETLRNLHQREGKVDGLTEFMDQLERQAFE